MSKNRERAIQMILDEAIGFLERYEKIRKGGRYDEFGVTHTEFDVWLTKASTYLVNAGAPPEVHAEWRVISDFSVYDDKHRNPNFHPLGPYHKRLRACCDLLVAFSAGRATRSVLDLLQQNVEPLACYPEVHELYRSALRKWQEGNYERNMLDDMRLALELLLCRLLSNSKSLENQQKPLGTYLKRRGVPVSFAHMFRQLMHFYSDYQNDYVKHDNRVTVTDAEFVMYQTALLIRYLNPPS